MNEERQRVIQEYVPGKQLTLLHIIAQPVDELYERLGVEKRGAIGIVTSTPGESAIIAADIATKAGDVSIGFLDRFTGALIISGDVASVEASLEAISKLLGDALKFTSCPITKS
ncbi:ethanolamine utilization microcompartment protein EutS [Clostridium sp.]|jgi:ethanolamine utilization protein EutS|uniref:ethanolamine utilization microcompartment protein EutS n=1 Tax=Clostridium sp. TaxID=1506 RepID=UPI003EE8C9AA